ncbi:MAG: DUF523 domain-containing protein [Desulfamplus sp.]|nr:DUF523 domain-containing protein [Desulfamplus sp.]
MELEPVKIGMSICLLGEPVRYDGGDKRDRFITDILEPYFIFVPVCPEVECGMTTPREPMHLVGDPENPRLVVITTGEDKTEIIHAWMGDKLSDLEKAGLGGYIFKSRSPSCGLYRIKVYDRKGHLKSNNGRGIFTRAFMDRFPGIPVEDEERLRDPGIRENFIKNIFKNRVPSKDHTSR